MGLAVLPPEQRQSLSPLRGGRRYGSSLGSGDRRRVCGRPEFPGSSLCMASAISIAAIATMRFAQALAQSILRKHADPQTDRLRVAVHRKKSR